MNIVNLTPHTINIHNDSGALVLSVPPSGQVARVTSKQRFDVSIDGVPFYTTEYGEITGLPESPADETIYIVSGMVRTAAKSRDIKRGHLYQPGELLRDDAGRVIGCIGLSQ